MRLFREIAQPTCFNKIEIDIADIDLGDIEIKSVFQADKEFRDLAGQSLEWLFIEVLVYMFYLFTMAIIMIQSRFIKVGIDNSK